MANVIPIVKRIQVVSDGGRQVRAKLCTCQIGILAGVMHKRQQNGEPDLWTLTRLYYRAPYHPISQKTPGVPSEVSLPSGEQPHSY